MDSGWDLGLMEELAESVGDGALRSFDWTGVLCLDGRVGFGFGVLSACDTERQPNFWLTEGPWQRRNQ